jgi:hypothetical protein
MLAVSELMLRIRPPQGDAARERVRCLAVRKGPWWELARAGRKKCDDARHEKERRLGGGEEMIGGEYDGVDTEVL